MTRLKTCAEPGCPELIAAGTRCETHHKAKRRQEDRRRPGGAQRGWTKEWQRTRREYLAAFPACQHPAGCLEPATDVHHLDGCGRTGEQAHDWANLQGLCHAHHSQTTAREQPGGFRSA